jgi:glycosyltransferase involved in cell wall biosynthesis
MNTPNHKYTYCVFFTKLFPYGILENYIFNELEFLSKTFDKVLLVPHEEFEYPESGNRFPPQFSNIEIVRINKDLPALSKWEKALFAWRTWWLMAEEIATSRERDNHIRTYKALFGQLYHMIHSGMKLKQVMDARGFTPENTVMYHYWFHRGVIVSAMINRYFSNSKYHDVSRAHSLDLYHKDWNSIYKGEPLFLPYEQIRWKEIDRVFTISTHGFNHLSKTFPHYKGKLEIARLGVHGSATFQTRTEPNERKVIITCSLLNGNKRLHLLPDILKHVSVNVDWYHFGHGSDEDKNFIREKCKACKTDVQVHFMGAVPNTTILKFYNEKAIDLIVNLSEAEGIPVALMEAAAQGVPMLATQTVGNPEIVNNENGLLIPIAFNAEEVGSQVNELFLDFELWKAKSEAARRTWENQYNAPKNYADFYQNLSTKK